MEQLTDKEISILKHIIYRTCAFRIKDKNYLEDISIIYQKIFNEDLKEGYGKWIDLNKKIMKGEI